MRQSQFTTMNVWTDYTRRPRGRRTIVWRVLTGAFFLATLSTATSAATYHSANFDVTAASADVARQMAEIAEIHREKFLSNWLGDNRVHWNTPCQVLVEERASGGEGWVSYETFRGKAEKVRIHVAGQLDHIAEYVLPHEVAHAVLAVSMGRPLPRWADEGVALLFEPESQRARQRKRAADMMATDGLMPLEEVLALVDYPAGHQQLVGFYTSCFSLTEYLVERGGRQRLLNFVDDGERYGWEASLRHHYHADMQELEQSWHSWVPGQQRDDDAMQFAAVSQTIDLESASGP